MIFDQFDDVLYKLNLSSVWIYQDTTNDNTYVFESNANLG